MKKILIGHICLIGLFSSIGYAGFSTNKLIVTSSASLQGGIFTKTITTTTNYSLTDGSSFLLASCVSSTLTITLPSVTTANHFISITKIDTSSYPVKLNGNGSTLIANSTGTIYLYAQNANIRLISDGTDWWPLGKMPGTLPYIGFEADPNSAQATGSTQTVVYRAIYIPEPCIAYGIRFSMGAGAGGNVDVGIYSNKANGLGPNKKLANSGTTANPGASGIRQVNFTSQINLLPGTYWLAMQWDSTTPTLGRSSIDGIAGTLTQTNAALPLPTSANATVTTNARQWALVLMLRGGTSQ